MNGERYAHHGHTTKGPLAALARALVAGRRQAQGVVLVGPKLRSIESRLGRTDYFRGLEGRFLGVFIASRTPPYSLSQRAAIFGRWMCM